MTYNETLRELFNNMMKPPKKREKFMIINEEYSPEIDRDKKFGCFLLDIWGSIEVIESFPVWGKFENLGIFTYSYKGEPLPLSHKLITSDKWCLKKVKKEEEEE